MCKMSPEFLKFVRRNWPVGDAKRPWRFSLDRDQEVLVFRSNGEAVEVPLPQDTVLVLRKGNPVFVGLAREGKFYVKTERGRKSVFCGRNEVFSRPAAAGWLDLVKVHAKKENPRPSRIAREVVARLYGGKAGLLAMRWQELVRLAHAHGVPIFVQGQTRNKVVADLLACWA